MKRRVYAIIFLLIASGTGTWLYNRLGFPVNGPGDGGPDFGAMFAILAAALFTLLFALAGLVLLFRRPRQQP